MAKTGGIGAATQSPIPGGPGAGPTTKPSTWKEDLKKTADFFWKPFNKVILPPLKSMAKSLLTVVSGIAKTAKLTLMGMASAVALLLLVEFLNSPQWREWRKELIPKLTDGLNWLGG